MCKLIRTRSDVLALVLKAQYVNEVAAAEEAPPERKDDRMLRVRMMER